MRKILTEASGSLTSGYLIKSIKESGHISVASDIDSKCFGRYLADDFITMPRKDHPELWGKIEYELENHKIDVVIPSLDETLLGWANRKHEFLRKGTHVIVSDACTVRIFQDKWLTYLFFKEAGIPTPATSLQQEYPLVKPQIGRGAVGVKVTDERVVMDGMISQELIEGEEYTVDVFCDRNSRPIYIVPRKRLGVKEGKSTGGIVIHDIKIIKWIRKICESIKFIGPINVQCFVCKDGSIKFIEINTRVAGGMALSFAATENWIKLIVDHFVDGVEIESRPVRYGMEMKRYYAEVFIPSC